MALALTYPLFLVTTSLRGGDDAATFILGTQVRAFLMFSLAVLYSGIMFQFFKYYMARPGKPNPADLVPVEGSAKGYLPVYLLIVYCNLAALWTWLRLGRFFCVCWLLSLSLLTLVWQVAYRPYFRILDNIGITLNSIIASTFLVCVLVSRLDMVPATETNHTVLAVGMTAVLALSFLLSVVRLIIGVKNRPQTTSESGVGAVSV